MSYLKKITLSLGVICGLNAQALESIGLNQVREQVKTDSLQIQKIEASHEEAQAKSTEAFSAYLPRVDGAITYLTNKRYMLVDFDLGAGPTSIAQVLPTTNYSLTAKWNVFDGFASTERYLGAKQYEQASSVELDWTKFQTDRAVILAYYKVLGAEKVKLVAEQNVASLQEHYKNIEAMKKAGISTQYDLLRTEVLLSEAENDLLLAQDNIVLARQKLGEVLGKEKEDRELNDQFPKLSNLNLDYKNLNNKAKGDLVSLQNKAQAAEYMSKSASLHYLPKINLFAEYDYYNNKNSRFDDDQAFRESYSIGVQLSWALFEGGISYAKDRQAFAQKVQIEKTARQMDLKSQGDIEFWGKKFNYFKSLYLTKTKNIERSQESLRLAKVGQKVGVRTNTDILEAQTDVYKSQADQVNAQIGVIEALINLELSTGVELYKF